MPPIKMVYICPSNTQIVQFIKVKSTSCKGLKGKIYIRPAVTTFLYTWIFGHRTLPWVNLEVWWCSNSRGSMPGRMWHWLCRPEACTRITRFSCFIRRKKKTCKIRKIFQSVKIATPGRPETKSSENSAAILLLTGHHFKFPFGMATLELTTTRGGFWERCSGFPNGVERFE